MPSARCIICNKRFHFRSTKGNKLEYHTCNCGGKYETVGGNYYISGKNPFEPQKTFTSKYLEGEFYHAEANRKKQMFYRHPDGYWKPIIDF